MTKASAAFYRGFFGKDRLNQRIPPVSANALMFAVAVAVLLAASTALVTNFFQYASAAL